MPTPAAPPTLAASVALSIQTLSTSDPEKALTTITASQPIPDGHLVAFTQPTDPDNPKDWPSRTKWAVTSVLSATGFNRIMVSTIMAPALTTIAAEFHMNSTEANMSLSVYLLATAFGPLLIGPLSEMYGRAPVLHASNVWFVVWNLVCGFSNSKGMLIASRLLAGFGASAIYALGGGVLGDLWRPEQRGWSLSVYSLIPLLAPAVGPIIGGYLTEGASWRWVYWATSIIQGVLVIFCFLIFKETYAPLILERRARRLRRETGDERYYTVVARLHEGRSVRSIAQQSLTRPLRLLAFHPIIQAMASLSAFYYGILYIVITTFSTMYITVYGDTVATSGLHYIALTIGEMAGSLVGGPLMDVIYRRLKTKGGQGDIPEYRVPLILPGALIAPLGLFLYGWAIHYLAPWPVVDLGIVVTSFGLQIAGQAITAYIIDAYHDHVSSTIAAAQFLKSLTAFAFPLIAPKMYEALGYGWANSTLAFIGLGVGVPAPLLLWVYGAKLRGKNRSSY
ncbi:hypothetical protein LTR36_006154 [Oleoguttula mirabilis]|uniref:Cercosporin MFS transporter CTB4 n=1 Tax=Oleoguttula mirabilis TaxID=1507867 RepID=A0AAV9JCG5_9PEZI|nr:hypothetical protein LTR36_006154 [Oleoguttula mirabilis]